MLKEMLGDAYRPEMTHEELDAALSAAGITFDGNELERLKKALSKSNSEAAEYKRQLRAKLSDDEAKAQQEAEERKKMQDATKRSSAKTPSLKIVQACLNWVTTQPLPRTPPPPCTRAIPPRCLHARKHFWKRRKSGFAPMCSRPPRHLLAA